jgi:hypothetical protein
MKLYLVPKKFRHGGEEGSCDLMVSILLKDLRIIIL